MRDFKQRVLERHGFARRVPELPRQAEICPAISLTDLFGGAGAALEPASGSRRCSTRSRAYFSQAVVTPDPETGELGDTGDIAFGIRVEPLDEQQELIEDDPRRRSTRRGRRRPAAGGRRAEVAGLPVIAADANADLVRQPLLAHARGPARGRAGAARRLPLGCARALVPLIPIVLATGWSSLVLWAMDIPLNPMSATLGALVIAIATEFSVILSARYHEERGGRASLGEALRRTYARTGAAVLASGIDRDRRLRRADRHRHPDAARLRPGHRRRPRRRAARRDAGAAGGAGLGRGGLPAVRRRCAARLRRPRPARRRLDSGPADAMATRAPADEPSRAGALLGLRRARLPGR